MIKTVLSHVYGVLLVGAYLVVVVAELALIAFLLWATVGIVAGWIEPNTAYTFAFGLLCGALLALPWPRTKEPVAP